MMTPFIDRLATRLEQWLPAPLPVFEKPKYLNAASIEFADAAIEAARMETVRLYDKALELIVHGVGLRRRDVFGDRPLEEIEGESFEFEDRLQERYEVSIKAIYGAILEFISRAQEGMGSAESEQIFAIRMAGRDLIEAIKGVLHLQKNMRSHIQSDNPDIRAAYAEIRRRIGTVLREIDTVRRSEEDPLAILSLNAAKVIAKEQDVLANGKLDELVRGHRITAAEATSLINDNGYAYGVCKNLIELGKVLFAEHDEESKDAERSLTLDEDEIDMMTGDRF